MPQRLTRQVLVQLCEARGLTVHSESEYFVTASGAGAYLFAMKFPRGGWQLRSAKEERASLWRSWANTAADAERFLVRQQDQDKAVA